ncbi:hypothetical protein [Tenacibaculum ovolyticum]|uniref:hypothetical protein n=1 Tax=Tenacibaculum ovolyticum TaxID=104270 RepID=UPI003BA99ACE
MKLKATASFPGAESKSATIELISYEITDGWWTKDKEGTLNLRKAKLGDTVYFHIETKNIDCGEELDCKLFDSDVVFIWDYLNPDDDKFNKKEVHKKAIVKNNKATIELHLNRGWEENLKQDTAYDIELYWKVKYDTISKDVPKRKSLYLEVEFSDQTLFFKPSIAGGKLPQLIAKDGSPLFLTTLKDATLKEVEKRTKDEVKDKIKTKVKENISNAIKKYNNDINKKVTTIALVKLNKGHLIDRSGKLNTKPKNVYKYTEKVFNKEVTVKRAVSKTTNQAHYFATNGKKVEVLNAMRINPIMSIDDAEETLGNLFDLVSFSMMSLEEITSKPFSSPSFLLKHFLPKNAVLGIGLWVDFLGYVALLEHNKQEAMVDEIMQNKLERAKNEGLEAVRAHLNKYETDYHLERISNKTLSKLLIGEFKTFEDLNEFNLNKDLSGSNPEILYRSIYEKEKGEHHYIIETIFTNE